MMLVPIMAEAAQADVYVYRGAGATGKARMEPFIDLLGRKPAGVVEFAENSDWTHMRDSINWAARSWDGSYRMMQSVPMLMSTGTLAQGAAGQYDQEFAKVAQMLIANKQSDAMIRIGWEFNGDWYRWGAASDPTSWVTYYQRIVTAMRSVPGQQFKFIWNPALGRQSIAADRVYPGDAYVDYIGLDVYNQSWRPQDVDPATRWQGLVSQPYGLDWLSNFATLHDKAITLPEWGTGTRPDGHGGGDDPLFIENMAAWIGSHNVAAHGYWDYRAGDFDGEISDGGQPLSAEAFRLAFNYDAQAAVPEPASWLLMIAGFGLIGTMARRRAVGAMPWVPA
ncbi:PEPxxWA-CTERM sorting domain-containing protein [Glacieibacterium sp.]|uniref:PEPxxWA-CTERM sorting domain-containing protein n=1 Tax=Glacieibacterium sp. TaxID=2860237 RepID=UPI003B008982